MIHYFYLNNLQPRQRTSAAEAEYMESHFIGRVEYKLMSGRPSRLGQKHSAGNCNGRGQSAFLTGHVTHKT